MAPYFFDRGCLAEFIVASALRLGDGVRDEWGAFDLLTKSGAKIEVKSAAYLQSWYHIEPAEAFKLGINPVLSSSSFGFHSLSGRPERFCKGAQKIQGSLHWGKVIDRYAVLRLRP